MCARWQHLLDSQNIQSYNQYKKEINVCVIKLCQQNGINYMTHVESTLNIFQTDEFKRKHKITKKKTSLIYMYV